MTEYAVPQAVPRVELSAGAVLSRSWSLYKRLFGRSVLMGALVFGAIHLVEALLRAGHHRTALPIVSIVLTITGVALLQGGLIEIVRALHVDGDDDPSLLQAFHRAGRKVWKLIRVSRWVAFGVTLGMICLIVPGLVLATRWAVAVPVAMLEEGTPRSALRRSRAIIDGNGWNVFQVLFVCGLLNVLVAVPFALAAGGAGPLGRWIALTLASALTAPYVAHALTVVYYGLLQPQRPVVLEAGHRWESVWNAPQVVAEPTPEDKLESIWDEQIRKFEEREKQWGGG